METVLWSVRGLQSRHGHNVQTDDSLHVSRVISIYYAGEVFFLMYFAGEVFFLDCKNGTIIITYTRRICDW